MFLITGIILTFMLGLGLIILSRANLRILEQIVLAWVIGLGIVTQELFLLSVLNISYTRVSVILTLLITNFPIWLLLKDKLFTNKKVKISPRLFYLNLRKWFDQLTVVEQIILVVLTFIITTVFIKAIYWPVYYWDALALYDFRARIFFEAGGIAKSMNLASLPLHGFPALTSLAHTFVYILGGNNANPQFIYPLYYVALLITFYFSVRKYTKRWFSLLITLTLATIPFFIEFASNAYTNLPYAFYFGMGTVYLYRFLQEKNFGLLLIAGTLLGLAGWTRSPTEQFLLVNLIVLSIWCLHQKRYFYSPVVLMGLFLIFYIPWKLYIYYALGITVVATEISSAINAGVSSGLNLERLLTVVGLLINSIKDISGASLILAIVVTIFFTKQAVRNIYLLLFCGLNLLVFILGSYVFSLSWHDWQDSISNSANRLSMFLPPFILYYVGISVPYFLERPADLSRRLKNKT